MAAAAVVIALLIMLLVKLISGALGMTRPAGPAAPDPQFAEPAQSVTRPPEMEGEGPLAESAENPSAGWDQGELTPVDKTADELGREAEADD